MNKKIQRLEKKINDMEHTDIFKGPFKADECGCYIFCNNGSQMCFDVMDERDVNLGKRIAALLNEESDVEYFDDIGVSDDGKYICNGHSPILMVRGWGYLTSVLHIPNKEAIKIQNDFVKWAAQMLGGYYTSKLQIAEDKIKILTEKNKVMDDVFTYLRDYYGYGDRKIPEQLMDFFDFSDYDYVRPVGWIENCVIYKKNNESSKKYIKFYADGSEHSAEWYPQDKYAVCQWSEYDDIYHGYILLPHMSDIESEKDVISCYCFYYDC
jgi:hypothetical protein